MVDETAFQRFPHHKPYPTYKDSGVEWLGEIPAHWEVKRTKTLLSRNDSGVWGADCDDEGVVVLRSTEQTVDGEWDIREPAKRQLTPSEYAACHLIDGDLVVTKSSGSALHIGKTSIVTRDVEALNCCHSNFMQRLRVKKNAVPRYMWYVLNGELGRKQFGYYSDTTTGLANLNGEIIGMVHLVLPSLPEQRAIAAFLDRETTKIDALVAKKERLIELLQEKRTALISHAVTKGLDPGVPLKDSGVEWLGEIPAHWEVLRLFRLTPSDRSIMYGIVLPGPHVPDGVPIVKGGDVRPERLRVDRLNRTDPDIEAGYVRSRLRAGDLVYAIRGSIGDVAIIPDELEGTNLTQDAARVAYTTQTHGQWLLYTLKSSVTFAQLDAGALGATIRGVNIRDLKRVVIPRPPLDEQRAIATFLDRETAQIDALVAKVQEAIDRLKELRTALISAAVTGKIDVRETAA